MGCCESEQGGIQVERRGDLSRNRAKNAMGMGYKKNGGAVPKLIYFSAYGKAEQLRMMLNHGGVEFEDIHINREEFNKMKENGELPGNQVPVWVDEDGVTFNQANAIQVLLGKKYGYYSSDPWEAYEDDWALAFHGDLWSPKFNFKFFKKVNFTKFRKIKEFLLI